MKHSLKLAVAAGVAGMTMIWLAGCATKRGAPVTDVVIQDKPYSPGDYAKVPPKNGGKPADAKPVPGGAQPSGARPPRYYSGTAFLRKGETRGYGLYTYVLFNTPPNDVSKARYLAVLEACFRLISEAKYAERVLGYQPEQMNVLYVPVGTAAPKFPADPGRIAEWALANYDYDFARGLLAVLDKPSEAKHQDGPYVVSVKAPLRDPSTLRKGYLYQDMSGRHPAIMDLWMKGFIDAAEQPQFWSEGVKQQWLLTVRDKIEKAADALDTTIVALDLVKSFKSSLATIFVWKS